MLKAFSSVEAAPKLPYDITAFEAWSSQSVDGKREERFFIVCWDKCHVGIYRLLEGDEAQRDPSANPVDLIHCLKCVTPYPITQLAVFPEFDFFLGLSDGEVYLIALSTGQLLERLMKGTKALSFAVDWTRLRAKSDSPLRICVGSKKKLHIFQYNKEKKAMLPSSKGELFLPAPPKGVAWLGDSVITCLKRDQYCYMSIATDDGTTDELFPAGSVKHNAVMLQLPTGELAVMVDKKMIIVNINLRQMGDITWSEPPLDVVYSEPYFLALLPSSVVEVRARSLPGIVQKVEMDKVKLIAGQGFHTFVSTIRDVVYLRPTSFSEQCDILVDHYQQYDLALFIAKLIPEGHKANKDRKTKIEGKHAFHLFVQRNYKEALRMFTGVEADPKHVIALYPTLLPSETRKKILSNNFPSLPPTLAGDQLEEATTVLIEYLNEICRMLELSRSGLEDQEATVPLPPSWEIQDERKMMTLLVTTMLKCYLMVNQSLVAPFVRRKGRALDLQESEKCLKMHKRYEDLVELYKAIGKHEEALTLLFDCHKHSFTRTLEGIRPTREYLKMLGNANIDIVFRFSVWVLEENAEGGLKIFTDDQDEVRELDRVRVVQHLEQTCVDNPTLVQEYLEHVIHQWEDSNPVLRNKLVELYQDEAQALVKLGKDDSVVRQKLLMLLKSSEHVTAESVVTSFPNDGHPQDYAGKTFHFVERPPEGLVCAVCYALAHDPVQANCCGKIYCTQCIEKWKTRAISCPACRSTVQSDPPFNVFRDRKTHQDIQSLSVHCPNWKDGCDKKMDLSEVDNHLTSDNGCPFQVVDCGNRCGHKDMRTAVKKHMTSECHLRHEKCQYCPLDSTYEQVTGAHLKECPGYPLNCPNKCGAQDLTRSTVPAHREVCPLQQVECEYKHFGCAVVVLRKEVEKHLQTSVEIHLQLTKNKVEEQLREAARERQRMNEIIARLVDRVEQLELK